ncbi:MAG: nucleoside hydrolase, partial [Planctomycetota bacterium]
MPKKLLIDCDPGIGDAMALAIAMFEPRIDLLAVTATEGVASAELTTRNVHG